MTGKLEELESCGFIRKYYAFGMKKKNAVYQLIDCFILFHFKFLQDEPTDEHFWTNQINTPAVNTWMGLAFERVCMQHVAQIKNKLGISGVLTEINSWYCKADPDRGVFGSQIDMLITRKDQVINLCEMKYSDQEYEITRAYANHVEDRLRTFRKVTNTKKSFSVVYVTPFGLHNNMYARKVNKQVTADDLFMKG